MLFAGQVALEHACVVVFKTGLFLDREEMKRRQNSSKVIVELLRELLESEI